MRKSISWAARSRLTCSRHFQSSGCTYFPFMSDTIIADSSCYFWLGCAHFHFISSITMADSFCFSDCGYFHFMSSAISVDMFPLLWTLSGCVFPVHKQHNHGLHIPATFISQIVRNSILWAGWAAQSWLTCSRTFASQIVRISISWVAQSRLICSRHRVCVFPFYEQHNHCWHVPATFNYQEVRISIS